MRTIIMLAAAGATLAACGTADETDEQAAEAAEATLESTAMGDIAGTYEIAMADGTVILQTINADGTYVETTPEGAETQRGTWRAGDAGAMCFDPEGDEGEECYSGGAPDEEGAFELRGEDGAVQSTVRRVPEGSGETDEQTAADNDPAEPAE